MVVDEDAPATAIGLGPVFFDPDVVTSGDALSAAKELAAAITANGPLAVKVSKQIIVESRGWPLDKRYEEQAKLLPQVFMSEDAREGSLAFAEKRAPNWKGK